MSSTQPYLLYGSTATSPTTSLSIQGGELLYIIFILTPLTTLSSEAAMQINTERLKKEEERHKKLLHNPCPEPVPLGSFPA